MPLTRHLYREDEVAAALQLCVLRGRSVEAAFWCSELLDSGMADAFIAAMRQIWLFGFGIGALSWYKVFQEFAAAEAVDASEALRLVVALCRTGVSGGRDTSYMVLALSKAPADQVGLCMTPKGLTGVDAFFAAAILQGRTLTAWRALSSIGEGTLRRVAEFKHGAAGLDVLGLYDEAIAIAALCLPRGELASRLAAPLPEGLAEVDSAVAEWDALLGRRARRQHPIPQDCLYWITARGNTTVYTSSEGQLRGSLERPGKLWGSTFWDSIVEDWQAIRSDDDVREAFYDEYFPDDIPDEWSAEARQVSHGFGSLQPGSTASAERFMRAWFGRIPSAVLWNAFETAIHGLDAKNWDDIAAKVGEPVTLNMTRLKKPTLVVGS